MSDKSKIYNYIKKTINPYAKPFEGTAYELGLKIMDYIENMDDEKENGWIPVSDRLSEECVPVNIVWTNRNPETYYSKIKNVPFSATGVYYNGNWYWYSSTCVDYLAEYGKCEIELVDKAVDITHWQPLPEPPHMED